jgi:hypothetical protein
MDPKSFSVIQGSHKDFVIKCISTLSYYNENILAK